MRLFNFSTRRFFNTTQYQIDLQAVLLAGQLVLM